MRAFQGKYGVIFILCVILGLSALVGRYLQNSFWLQKEDSAFRCGLLEAVTTLDPALMQERGERVIGANLYEGLVALAPNTLELQPGLAASWQVSDDARVFTFQLRPKVRFHTGRLVTAMDVKSAWERVIALGDDAPLHHLFLPIQGAPEKLAGQATEVTGIQVLNSRTLSVTLTAPDVSFLSRLSQPPFWILDTEYAQRGGEKFGLAGETSAGTGPFYLTKGDVTQNISLARHQRYWGPKPSIARCQFFFLDPQDAVRLFKEGKLDYLEGAPSLEDLAFFDTTLMSQSLQTQLLDNYFYQFNLADPYWGKSPLLRQAINYALDRPALIACLFLGEASPMEAFIPDGVFGYQPPSFPYAYDPHKALALLTAAGHPQGKGLPPLELTYNDLPSHGLVAKEIKQQLNAIGIGVNLRAIPWSEYKDGLKNGEFTCFRSGWSWEYPDPDDFFYANFHSGQQGQSNLSFYQNVQVDAWLEAARKETKDQAERLQLYQEVERQLIKDAPILWLFSWQRLSYVHPRIQNLQITPFDQVYLHQVEFNAK